jgi:hypothetical protein
MRAFVARELQRLASDDRWICNLGPERSQEGENEDEEDDQTLTRPSGDLSRKRER